MHGVGTGWGGGGVPMPPLPCRLTKRIRTIFKLFKNTDALVSRAVPPLVDLAVDMYLSAVEIAAVAVARKCPTYTTLNTSVYGGAV